MNADDLTDATLETEIRAMFADRSARVPLSGAPYSALTSRIGQAHRRRRRQALGSLLAAALVATGAGVWAAGSVGHRSAPAPAGPPGQADTAVFEYADGTVITGDSPDAVAMRQAAVDSLTIAGKRAMAGKGYTVVTTFDRSLMAAAQRTGDAMTAQKVSALPAGTRLAFASVDPATGFVKAFYGGAGAFARNIRIGQLMEPLVLATALESGGFILNSTEPATNSRPLYFPIGSTQESDHITYVDAQGRTKNWPPPADDQPLMSFGPTATLTEGVEWSLSSVACDLEMEPSVTPPAVYTMARQLGMRTEDQDFAPIPDICQGWAMVSPAEVAGMYATFAAGGMHRNITSAAQVLDASGRIAWIAQTRGMRVMTPSAASEVAVALLAAANGGVASANGVLSAYEQQHPTTAGKTSTILAPSSAASAWFAGFGNDGPATAVALFNPDADAGGLGPRLPDILGSGIPATVWTRFAQAAAGS